MRKVSIIGAGVVGKAVGRILRERGYEIKSVVSRSMENAKGATEFIGGGEPGTDPAAGAAGTDWVFITTPDKAIMETCEKIAEGGGFSKSSLTIHMSGALGSDVLDSARKSGARALSIHPIQSLASSEQAIKNLPGSYFSIEGDAEAIPDGREIVEALGGLLVMIPGDRKALYHAGAAVASNYLVAVLDFAVMIYEALGMKREDAVKAIMPLVRGTVNNVERVGVPDALTGPIARGDLETVEGHLEALKKDMPEMLPLYKALGMHTVKVGLAKGSLAAEDGAKFREILK
ncbi:MAG: Rossmann-like and DUF2520 domain-containing protein [Nitrospirota bacterium]